MDPDTGDQLIRDPPVPGHCSPAIHFYNRLSVIGLMTTFALVCFSQFLQCLEASSLSLDLVNNQLVENGVLQKLTLN
jgi:hypothetical protein